MMKSSRRSMSVPPDGNQQGTLYAAFRGLFNSMFCELIAPITTQDDHRPESYRIDVDSIQRSNRVVGTDRGWAERRKIITPHIMESFAALESRRQTSGETLGLLRPCRLFGLDITPVKESDWTAEEKAKLMQDGLFDSEVIRQRAALRKLPYQFHYRYECQGVSGLETCRHLISDWEVGALYWNCQRSHGKFWETPFRHKLEQEFSNRDLIFLMGTMHRFPDQWLIVGLIYPPKPSVEKTSQLTFEFEE